jgi:hypothetical protein
MAACWFEGLGLRRGAGYFEILMTRFTTPDEVVGPVSIEALRNNQFRRVTDGFLPKSHAAFLDELFTAGPAILNIMLSILHGGVFHNGGIPETTDLLVTVAASNRIPHDPDLRPFFDRFVMRAETRQLSREEETGLALFSSWLREGVKLQTGERVPFPQLASLHDLRVLNRVLGFSLPEPEAPERENGWLHTLADEQWNAMQEGFFKDATVGEMIRLMLSFQQSSGTVETNVRRMLKLYKVMRARAALRGDFYRLSQEDLRILEFSWEDPRYRESIARELTNRDIPDLSLLRWG